MYIQIKHFDDRLHGFKVEYATEGAAAIDLRACSVDGEPLHSPMTIGPGTRVTIGTGMALDLVSASVCALVLPRSGLGRKGITLGNSPGLIDSDYHGELLLALWNSGPDEFRINPMDRLAQLMITPVIRAQFVPVTEFSRRTSRGTGGFGSTGVA